MITARAAWALGKVLIGEPLNGDEESLPENLRGIARRISEVAPENRLPLWDAFLEGRPDRDELIQAVARADPSRSPPDAVSTGSTRTCASLADIRKIVDAQPWLWPGWIASGVLNALASEPGTGKTRFALDLARRLWFGLPWPDDQENDHPVGSRTLWIQGDRNFAEMLKAAADFGLPDDAVLLGSTPDKPMEGLDLDDASVVEQLVELIEFNDPSLVIIDTVGMVTSRNLCKPEDAREFFAPIMEAACKTGKAFLGLTHLSANKEALGRRIVEKARVVMKMTQPDPEEQPNRRRLWVDKSAVVKPVPLGTTMKDDGNDYDFEPPTEPEPERSRPGPAPAKTEACAKWLSEELKTPAPVKDLISKAERAGYAKPTVYRAKDSLQVVEFSKENRKCWRLRAGPEPPDFTP